MILVRKIVSFIFILIIIVVSFKYSIFESYISCHKTEYRKVALSEVRNNIFVISIPEFELYQNFEWNEKNKELVINGKYFEVIKVTKQNNIFELTLVSDNLENKLYQTFFSSLCHSNSDGDNFFILLLTLNFLDQSPFIFKPFLVVENRIYFEKEQLISIVTSLKKIKPPQIV